MNKKFRVNVVVMYFKNTNINNFQPPIFSLLKTLAWLHNLDYAIEPNSPAFYVSHLELYGQSDLIYFRSTSDTQIDAKAFRKIISDIFYRSRAGMLQGAQVFYQLQKTLPQYPFPKDYIRPLNYPYLEVHKDGQTSVCTSFQEIPNSDDD
ncbi:MAG: hypothetical protein H7289_07690 [Mucilaginibacter sp.]|nr:hypothetical protein [Mucilaginibacter sp.]